MNNKDIDDYKKEIHSMINEINDLSRIFRLWSYIKRVFQIHKEENEED